MRRLRGLHLAVLVVLAANAMALWHAMANRKGEAEAEIEMTNRELSYHYSRENSAVFLRMNYRGAARIEHGGHAHYGDSGDWITEEDLRRIGFDCSVAAKDRRAHHHYQRQPARRVIAAFEYDGEAWKAVQEAMTKVPDAPPGPRNRGTRLVAVGIGTDVASMRARFPDRSKAMLLPAAVHIYAGPERVQGRLSGVPVLIHVPHEFSHQFRQSALQGRSVDDERTLYKVRLRYGANLEPWVVGVEFPR